MVKLDILNEGNIDRILDIWKNMKEEDKAHFINQVALAMSIWGTDEQGKQMVVEILKVMTDDKSQTLADFGLYVKNAATTKIGKTKKNKIEKAALVVEGYRIKNSMSSEPHRELV